MFPEKTDPRIVLAYGQYESIKNSNFHYQHNSNPAIAEKHSLGFRLKSRKLSNKFTDLKINYVEQIAISAIFLCNEREFSTNVKFNLVITLLFLLFI